MGTQFFWFFDVILVGILVGVTYKGARRGFVTGLTNFAGALLGFVVALAISAPAATYVYDSFVSPGVVEKLNYFAEYDVTENSTNYAFDTLRTASANMSEATVDGRFLEDFLLDNPPIEGETLKLHLKNVGLEDTGIAEGNLKCFGLDAMYDFIEVDVGFIDITAAERASNSIEDIILARTVSYRMADRAGERHQTLTANLSDMVPGVTKASEGSVDLVAKMLLYIMTNDANDLAEVIDANMVRPLMVMPFRLLIFSVIFALMGVLISAISNHMDLVDRLTVIGKTNTLLGGVIGLILAVVIIFMVAIAVRMIVTLTGDNIIFINSMTIDKTYAFKYVYDLWFLRF